MSAPGGDGPWGRRSPSDGLMRLLLRGYPASFRRRYGSEVLRVFRERRARIRDEEGRMAAWRFTLRDAAGLAWGALRSRLGRGEGARARRSGSGSGTGPGRPGGVRSDGGGPLEGFGADLAMAVRTLVRSPGFTLATLVVLALGIGANTAVFSAVNAVLLRPLPVDDPGELVMLWESNPEKGWERETAAPANVLDWREQVDAFEDVAVFSGFQSGAALTSGHEPTRVTLTTVSGNFFSVLGVEALVGRTFRWEETWTDAPRVAVLSAWYWRERFGSDPDVVGRTLTLDGRAVEVVGVVPSPLRIRPEDPAIWYPVRWDPASVSQAWFRRAHWVRPIARLEDGVTLEEARRQLETVAARLEAEYSETNRLMGAGLTPLHDFLVGDRKPVFLTVMGGVGLLLLLACTNVANLFLVRTAERRRELAVRTAMGAGRSRVLRQLLGEGALLALVGGLLGLGVGAAGLRVLSALQPPGLVPGGQLRVDPAVLGFTALVTLASVVFFALVPALRASGLEPGAELKDGARSGTGAGGWVQGGAPLVAVEVALAVVVLSGAGLLGRSLLALREVDPGFEWEDRIAAALEMPGTRFQDREAVVGFVDELLRRVEGRPGVRAAAVTRQLPLTDASWTGDFKIEGTPPGEYGVEVVHREVTPDYFRAMGVPLIRGRFFTDDDDADAEPVVLINEAFAERHFHGQDPVGRRMIFQREYGEGATWRRIVGVVGSEHQASLRAEPRIEVFEPFRQSTTRGVHLVVHTRGDPTGLVPAIRREVAALDPAMPLYSVRTLESVRARAMERERFVTVLLGAFAAVALLLATVGVYGVTARVARHRTREIGIRIAVGAGAADVLRLVLSRGLALVTAGVLAGAGGAVILGGTLESLLFRVSAVDAPTLGTVCLVLGGVALVACWVPARRATRVDPVRALRAE